MPAGEFPTDVTAPAHLTEDVALRVRRAVYRDGGIDAADAELLLALDEAAERRDPAWVALFTEALADHVVHGREPAGFVSDADADWLIERIARDGRVRTQTELELLVKVLEAAAASPDRLAAFALRQVKIAVLTGEGPLAGGGRLVPGRVGRAEADLLRRILFAFGGGGNVAVTQAEAEVLFDINDATAGADNDPAWPDLFVKAVANFMMAASGYEAPSRAVALRRAEWLDSPTEGVGAPFGALGRMMAGVLEVYRRPEAEDAWAERNRAFAASVAASEAVTAEEAAWLARRIGRDGALHDNERLLLRFIRDESPDIHPSLRALIAKAA